MVLIIFTIAVLAGIAAMQAYFSANWNKALKARVQFQDETITEGMKGEIVEKIRNYKRMPLPFLIVSFELDKSIPYDNSGAAVVTDKIYRNDMLSIGAREKLSRKFQVSYTRRGLYQIHEVTLKSKVLFGTEILLEQYDCDSQIYVFPAYSSYKDIFAPFSRVLGEALKNRFLNEDPFEFRGIRDYTSTDPMNKINWRATAKTGDIKVNTFFDTSCRTVTLFLDINNSQVWVYESCLEELIRVTRNYLEGFYKNHIPVTIYTNGLDVCCGTVIEFQEGTGAGYLENTLRKLARIDLGKKTEPLAKTISGLTKDKDGLSVMLSTDAGNELKEAYEAYLQGDSGEWILPVSGSAVNRVESRQIHTTYLEVAE